MVFIEVVVIFVTKFKFSQLEVFFHYSTPTQAHTERSGKNKERFGNLTIAIFCWQKRIGQKNSHIGCLKHVDLTSACEQVHVNK
jgi:hypothetical protein